MTVNQKSLPILPFTKPCNASVSVPGSKSISNRALILSVMCGSEVELNGLLESEDVDLMQVALQDLGIKINKSKNKTTIQGTNGIIPKNEAFINVGNAGTIARFLTCLLAVQKNGKFHMDGTKAMRNRPMKELLDCLKKHGCRFEFLEKNGHFPFFMESTERNCREINIDAKKSGQNISGILMQCNDEDLKYRINFKGGTVSVPFVEMTLKMMQEFSKNNSLNYNFSVNQIELNNCSYKNSKFSYDIEPDATAASYFMTLPLIVGGECEVKGMRPDMLQGDIAYCNVLNQVGAEINFTKSGVLVNESSTLDGGFFDFNDISDTFLTLAAISPLLSGSLEIFGIEHTRKQETDRVSAMATELKKLGQEVEEKKDRLIIHPNLNKLCDIARNPILISTYNDHRFAMSFSILGSFDLLGNGKPWLQINNPFCCSKTFPGFFDSLNTVRNESHG